MPSPKVFVSYTWEDAAHRRWVKKLATRLRADGVDVMLDAWAVAPGEQLPHFMEAAVRANDYVVIVATPRYKVKSDSRTGGVGYEGDIITAEVMTKRNHRKFIPILRRGGWSEAAPSWLLGAMYIDMRGRAAAAAYGDLLDTIHQKRPVAPPLGAIPASIKHPNLGDLLVGFLVGSAGRLHLDMEWFQPTTDHIAQFLRSEGLDTAVDQPRYPPKRDYELALPGMSFTGGLVFVLDASIHPNSTAVVVNEIVPQAIKPAFVHLGRLYKKAWRRHGFHVGMRLEIYFARDYLSVITAVMTTSANDTAGVDKLVAQAQWQALKWVEEHGIATRALTFTVQSATLAKYPRTT